MTDNRFLKYLGLDIKRVTSRYLVTMLAIVTIPITVGLIVGLFSVIYYGHWYKLGEVARLVIFFLTSAIFVISYPASAYGYVTGKDTGSEWALIPASRLEKFLSMNLNVLVVAPLVFTVLYLAADWLMTATGLSAGDALATLNINEYTGEMHVSQFPILYFGYVTNVLYFLLGAVFFRKSKVVLTILCLIGLNIVTGMAAGLVGVNISDEFVENSLVDPNGLMAFLNAVFWASTAIIVALLEFLIWLRIKKISY